MWPSCTEPSARKSISRLKVLGRYDSVKLIESHTHIYFSIYSSKIDVQIFKMKCKDVGSCFLCVPVYYDGARMQGKTMIEQIGFCHATPANQWSGMYWSATQQRLFMPYRYRKTVFIAERSSIIHTTFVTFAIYYWVCILYCSFCRSYHFIA